MWPYLTTYMLPTAQSEMLDEFVVYVRQVYSCRFSGATSLNAAMFSAVLLASRLPTSLHVLALMVLAVGLFGLYPLALQDFKVRVSRHCHVGATVLSTARIVGAEQVHLEHCSLWNSSSSHRLLLACKIVVPTGRIACACYVRNSICLPCHVAMAQAAQKRNQRPVGYCSTPPMRHSDGMHWSKWQPR